MELCSRYYQVLLIIVSQLTYFCLRNDPFSKQTVSTRPVSARLGRPPGEKKKPPPRPPPPKFAQKNQQRQVRY
jgi:hypothetical protein